LLSTGALLGLAVALIVLAPAVPILVVAAAAFGFVGATFYTVVQATCFALHPEQAGMIDAVVSTISLAGLGFPTLVRAISDSFGLTVGLGTYATISAVCGSRATLWPISSSERKIALQDATTESSA
jgi:hypothetical protein